MEYGLPHLALDDFDPMSVLIEDAVHFEGPELVYDFIDALMTSQRAAVSAGTCVIKMPCSRWDEMWGARAPARGAGTPPQTVLAGRKRATHRLDARPTAWNAQWLTWACVPPPGPAEGNPREPVERRMRPRAGMPRCGAHAPNLPASAAFSSSTFPSRPFLHLLTCMRPPPPLVRVTDCGASSSAPIAIPNEGGFSKRHKRVDSYHIGSPVSTMDYSSGARPPSAPPEAK